MPLSVIPLKVAVRARPLIQKELDEGCQSCLTFAPGEPQVILGKNRAFTYDYVFKPTDQQIPVYEDAVKPLLVHIFKGYNATVLAYGQTGSGKTFTMGGGYEASLKMDPEGMGVIPRIVQEIFLKMDEKEEYEYTTKLSYLEIINEDLQDLLVSTKKDSLNIREDNGEIKIPGLREISVNSAEAVMRCLEQGSVNRTVGSTAMNNTSSRSHAIFIITIEQKHKEDINDFWRSKLQLVDLAGSERVKKTHAEGERFKEGVNINKGLLALGNVISALGEDNQKTGPSNKHIPYRDSKLTRILQDSLGGNSHTLMIACISPADSNMEETINSLRYADRARKIKNKPVVNWDPQTAEIMRLKDQVSQLTMKLLNHGLLDVSESTMSTDSLPVHTKTEIIKRCEKCPLLEDENGKLSQQLQMTLDQVYASTEKVVRMETKNERLVSRLHDLEEGVGIDFDLLSSTVTADNHPELVQQLEKLKAIADKLNYNKSSEEMTEEENSIVEDEEVVNGEDEGIPDTPESRELVRQFTQKRAERTKELEQINKMIENNQRLRDQMSHNDQKMQEQVARQYEEKIASLQTEKDELHVKLEEAQTNTAAMKLSETRRKRLMELEQQISEFRKKLNEQKNIVKLKEQSEKKVSAMNTEIQALKQQRVKLMKQMKEDNLTYKKWKQQKDKEVLQLQQKDRKRQFEIQKLQRENQKQHAVLQRKSEEAAAANRRLKEALAKQKKVLEEKNQKFEKYDNTNIGNRIKKLLSYELDVQVGIYEAKYHRDELMTDRKTLSEELKTLKESLDDNGPPSKVFSCRGIYMPWQINSADPDQITSSNQPLSEVFQLLFAQFVSDLVGIQEDRFSQDSAHIFQKMAWMDNSGTKCQTSFQEEEKRKKIEELQHQIEYRNIQISDLQQKIFDADQEVKGKSIKDTVHTMMEAKIGLKWLLQQAVSFKANNSQLRVQLKDMKDDKDESGTENENYIETLEKDMAEMKETHQATIVKLRQEHQKELEILLKSQEQPTGAGNSDQYKAMYEDLKMKYEKVEKNMTKFMYKSKDVALMPNITDDDEPAEARSPFLTPRAKPKYKKRTPAVEVADSEIDDDDDDFDENNVDDNKDSDPDWARTPLLKRDLKPRRKTDLFKQNIQNQKAKTSDSKHCKCQTNCKTKRCACRKAKEFCDISCGCIGCDNKENDAATPNQIDENNGYKLPEIISSDMEDSQQTSSITSVTSSVLNTTFDVDEEKEQEPEVKKPKVKVMGKPPLKMKKQRGRSVLSTLTDNSIRSSDEFEKPMRKTTSSGSLRRRSNSFTKGEKVAKSASNLRKSGGLKKRSSSNTDLDKVGKTEEGLLPLDGLAKKRRLYNTRDSFFENIYVENKESS